MEMELSYTITAMETQLHRYTGGLCISKDISLGRAVPRCGEIQYNFNIPENTPCLKYLEMFHVFLRHVYVFMIIVKIKKVKVQKVCSILILLYTSNSRK
jgi:hypothetical protein